MVLDVELLQMSELETVIPFYANSMPFILH